MCPGGIARAWVVLDPWIPRFAAKTRFLLPLYHNLNFFLSHAIKPPIKPRPLPRHIQPLRTLTLSIYSSLKLNNPSAALPFVPLPVTIPSLMLLPPPAPSIPYTCPRTLLWSTSAPALVSEFLTPSIPPDLIVSATMLPFPPHISTSLFVVLRMRMRMCCCIFLYRRISHSLPSSTPRTFTSVPISIF
ncbi:hypothetical protein ACMFMG_012217 [Clarireedia jacksonii]